jgi:arylsulfatase A-like enzyme
VAPGSTAEATACLGDLFATVAEVVGEPLPEGAAEDSFSLLPALTGSPPTGPVRDHVIHHSGNGMFSVREGGWKLCVGLGSGGFSLPKRETPAPGGPTGQLYRLADDPAETRNVWLERPEVVELLSAILEKAQADGRTRP